MPTNHSGSYIFLYKLTKLAQLWIISCEIIKLQWMASCRTRCGIPEDEDEAHDQEIMNYCNPGSLMQGH